MRLKPKTMPRKSKPALNIAMTDQQLQQLEAMCNHEEFQSKSAYIRHVLHRYADLISEGLLEPLEFDSDDFEWGGDRRSNDFKDTP